MGQGTRSLQVWTESTKEKQGSRRKTFSHKGKWLVLALCESVTLLDNSNTQRNKKNNLENYNVKD